MLTVFFSQLRLFLCDACGDVLPHLLCCLWMCMLHAHRIAYKLWFPFLHLESYQPTGDAKHFHTPDFREARGGSSSVHVSTIYPVAMVSSNWLQLQVRGANVYLLHYNMLCVVFFLPPLGTPTGHDTGGVAKSLVSRHL